MNTRTSQFNAQTQEQSYILETLSDRIQTSIIWAIFVFINSIIILLFPLFQIIIITISGGLIYLLSKQLINQQYTKIIQKLYEIQYIFTILIIIGWLLTFIAFIIQTFFIETAPINTNIIIYFIILFISIIISLTFAILFKNPNKFTMKTNQNLLISYIVITQFYLFFSVYLIKNIYYEQFIIITSDIFNIQQK